MQGGNVRTRIATLLFGFTLASACASGADESASPGAGPGGSGGGGPTSEGGSAGGVGPVAGSGGGSAVSSGSGGSAGGSTGSAGGSTGSAGGSAGSMAGGRGGAPPSAEPPPSKWANATGNLAGMASECGNLGLVSAHPSANMVIAGVAKAGLWATDNGGKSWSKLGTGAGSATITNRISTIIYDPKQPGTFWESGIYNGGGVYRTTDNGQTFKQLGSVTHNDSLSVDLSDPERKTLLAGAHETASRLFRSSDGGATWSDIGKGLPSSAGSCNSTLALGASSLLVGCEGGGIFHSSDGATWTQVATRGVFPQPLLASDGTIYWLGSRGGLLVSTDQGQHFTQVADANVAPANGAPLVAAVELPDHRIVIMGKTQLQASADRGATWKPIGDPMPAPSGARYHGLAYSATTKTFFIWRWDCGSSVLPDAIMSSGFDYTKSAP
jgi:photosystem II stability/assembly factor-like uncharacterized protein